MNGRKAKETFDFEFQVVRVPLLKEKQVCDWILRRLLEKFKIYVESLPKGTYESKLLTNSRRKVQYVSRRGIQQRLVRLFFATNQQQHSFFLHEEIEEKRKPIVDLCLHAFS